MQKEFEKEKTTEVLENLQSLERSQKIKKLLIIAIISVLLIIIIFISFSAYFYFKSPEKQLSLGANIEEARLSPEKDVVYIKLAGESNKNITKIKFIFTDEQGNEHVYETSEGVKEIEVPFKRSFWDWLFGKPAFSGEYDYIINSNEIGLNDFFNIDEVSVLFEYKTETGEETETPVLDTTKTTTAPTTTTSGGGGPSGPSPCTPDKDCSYYYNLGECGSGLSDGCDNSLNCLTCTNGKICQDGSCINNCTNDSGCFSAGNFCDGNIPFNCSLNISDGCLIRINLTECNVEAGFICLNGTGCFFNGECTSDNNCSSSNGVCGGGICNSSHKCQMIFNSSATICRASSGLCGAAEYCTGGSALCPSDVNLTGNICRASQGICDRAETCAGTSSNCPTDIFNSSSTVCRGASGECDLAENCTGSSYSCPGNSYKINGTSCALGSCDGSGNCISNFCAGISLCGDYTDSVNCTNNPCDVGGGCEWNLTTRQCEKSPVLKTNNISQYNITWTFDKEYEYGQFANGDYWVVGPVTITNISPGWDGEKHGSMVNPIPMPGQQGYDSRLAFFVESLVVQAPVTVNPNSSLISTISFINCSEPGAYCSGGNLRPVLRTAAVLTVLESIPVDNGATLFRPPYTGNNKPIYSTSNLRKDLLPNLALVPNTPKIQDVADKFKRVWLEHFPRSGDFEQYTSPSENMPNYGREYSQTVGDASLLLMLDEQELINKFGENKDTLLIRFVQLGIDLYETEENGVYWVAGGGVHSGRKLPILFAGLMLNHSGMKDIGVKSQKMPHMGFAEDGYTFYVEDKEIYSQPYSLNSHSSDVYPDVYIIGIVNVVNGSNVVEGMGTFWLSIAPAYAKYFGVKGDDQAYKPDGKAYKVLSIIDNTHLKLETNYTGQTSTAKSYKISGFIWYGHGIWGKGLDYLEYTEKHRGLPEWGMEPTKDESSNGLDWDASYRNCGNGPVWAGIVLSARVMNAKTLWNHDALFDYQDRWMEIEKYLGLGAGPGLRQQSKFAEEMWDTYRADYGCIWTRDDPNDIYSNGHYNCSDKLIKCEWQNSTCNGCILASSCSDYQNQKTCSYDPCSLKNCSWDGSSCVSSVSGSSSSLSPFAKLWNFLKSLLTAKTGKAILTGKTITGDVIKGNAVSDSDINENWNSKSLYFILSLLAVVILIIAIIIAKIKKNKTWKKKR